MEFNDWLRQSLSERNGTYWFRRLDEDLIGRVTLAPAIKAYVKAAHHDAIRHFGLLLSDDLDPFSARPSDVSSHLEGYPYLLEQLTLQGYLGEVLAGLVVEHLSPFGLDDWGVPAFMFRCHDLVFYELERQLQTGNAPKRTPGRPGDDFVAYRRDSDGKITHVLGAEAKCSASHSNDLLKKAHKQVGDKAAKSVSIGKLIDILRSRDDAEARAWVKSLQKFRHPTTTSFERFDLVLYLCGKPPKKRASWMPPKTPMSQYSARRKLLSIEVHIKGVNSLLDLVYRTKEDWDGAE